MAHRASWILSHGDIPEGIEVLHRCDNPPCVNPAHLFLGTQLANILDCRDKGRLRLPRQRGEEKSGATLTDVAVTEIRQRYANGERIGALAVQYSASVRVVSNAVYGMTWKDLPLVQRPDSNRPHRSDAKLNAEKAARIRAAAGTATLAAIAASFGVSQTLVQNVIKGKRWAA
jgi:hypothetical protein